VALLRENDKDFREVNKLLVGMDATISQKRAVYISVIRRPASPAERTTHIQM